eukprot:11189612-Lingulodinium_polyedra.AAC.1
MAVHFSIARRAISSFRPLWAAFCKMAAMGRASVPSWLRARPTSRPSSDLCLVARSARCGRRGSS